jgi:hypothetical protein
MTEPTATISPDEAFGRALVARTEFTREAVWLPLLSVHHLSAGQTTIDGKTFTECVIEGPAVVVLLAGATLEGCNLGVATNPRSLLYKPMGEKLAGVIGLTNCRFINCRFVQVGFTGSDEMLEEFETMLVSARSQAAGDQTS